MEKEEKDKKEPKDKEQITQFCPETLTDWRKWLKINHLKEKYVKVILYKKHTGKSRLSSRELMHEAICWGWIDTTANRVDEDRWAIKYVRRNEKTAKWGNNTLRYGKSLIKQGRMSPHGLKMYKIGLKRKPHDEGIPDNPRMPKDLSIELKKLGLLDKFNSISKSRKKTFYRIILKAKLPDTRNKRIKAIINEIKQPSIP